MFEDIEINGSNQNNVKKNEVNWMDFEKKFGDKQENTKTFNFEDFEFFDNKTEPKQINNKSDIVNINQNIASNQITTFDFSKMNNNNNNNNNSNNIFDFFNNPQQQTNAKPKQADQNIYDFFK
jgi:hypothetical protein